MCFMFEFFISLFATFDVKNLSRMVELYPNDFVDVLEVVLRHQLQIMLEMFNVTQNL